MTGCPTFERADLPPPRRGATAASRVGARRRAIRLADTRRLGRLVSWRIPGVHASQTYHELFRAYPFTVLDETRARARLRPVREDLDARARLPGARRRRGLRRLGRARHRARRLRALGRAEPTTARELHLRGARGAGRHPGAAAAEGGLGRARPVRAPRRRGAARAGGAPRRGRNLEFALELEPDSVRSGLDDPRRIDAARRLLAEAAGEALDRLAALSARLLGAAYAQVALFTDTIVSVTPIAPRQPRAEAADPPDVRPRRCRSCSPTRAWTGRRLPRRAGRRRRRARRRPVRLRRASPRAGPTTTSSRCASSPGAVARRARARRARRRARDQHASGSTSGSRRPTSAASTGTWSPTRCTGTTG